MASEGFKRLLITGEKKRILTSHFISLWMRTPLLFTLFTVYHSRVTTKNQSDLQSPASSFYISFADSINIWHSGIVTKHCTDSSLVENIFLREKNCSASAKMWFVWRSICKSFFFFFSPKCYCGNWKHLGMYGNLRSYVKSSDMQIHCCTHGEEKLWARSYETEWR